MMAKIAHMASKLETVAIITHHPAANGKTERGATAIFNNADFVLRIDRPDAEDKIRTLQLAKQKEGEAPLTLGYFDLPTRRLGDDSKGREVVSCYVRLCDKPEEPTTSRPKNYDNWLSAIEYACQVTDDFGRRCVARKTAIDNWKHEGRPSKEFDTCESYGIAKGDVSITREGNTALLVVGDIMNV